MRWYAPGAEAPPGRYVQPRTLQIRTVEGTGGTIEGGGAGRWLRLPPSAFPFVLAGVALAGLAWVLLLPLLGLAALLRVLVRETVAGLRGAAGPRRERRAHGR